MVQVTVLSKLLDAQVSNIRRAVDTITIVPVVARSPRYSSYLWVYGMARRQRFRLGNKPSSMTPSFSRTGCTSTFKIQSMWLLLQLREWSEGKDNEWNNKRLPKECSKCHLSEGIILAMGGRYRHNVKLRERGFDIITRRETVGNLDIIKGDAYCKKLPLSLLFSGEGPGDYSPS